MLFTNLKPLFRFRLFSLGQLLFSLSLSQPPAFSQNSPVVQAASKDKTSSATVNKVKDSTSAIVPLLLTGWNGDVILENTSSPSTDFFDAGHSSWFEARLEKHTNGLPANRLVPSLVKPGVVFKLQPYDQPNVLRLTVPAPAQTLTLPQPTPYSRLYVLASSANGGGYGSLSVEFADGTSSGPFPFLAPEWWDGGNDITPRRAAAGGFARNLEKGPALKYEDRPPGFSLHQTDIDLREDPNFGKPIKGLRFTRPNGDRPLYTYVFAVSAAP